MGQNERDTNVNFAELRFWGYFLVGLFVVLVFRLAFGQRASVDKVGLLFLGLFCCFASAG